MNLAGRYRNLEDPLRTERWVELALMVVALLLVLQLLWGGVRAVFPAVPEPVQPRSDSLQVIQLESGEQIDPALRAQIAARPLFWASRRPQESQADAEIEALAAAEAASQNPGKIEGIKLRGVFGAGNTAGIIVLAKGKKRRVMVGEDVEGWKLQSVEPSEAIFSSLGREARLALKQGTIQVSRTEAATPRGVAPERKKKSEKASENGQPRRPAVPAKDRGPLTLGGRPQKNES